MMSVIQSPPLKFPMLAATSRSLSHFLSFSSPSPSPSPSSLLRRHFKPISSTLSQTKKMSSSTSSPSQFIEHIVLLKTRPETDPSKISLMLTNLNNLVSLKPVLHLSTCPVLTVKHLSSTLSFTHILHSRYLTKPDLDTYSLHPSHVSVVSDYVAPIVSDVMAVDWVANDVTGPLIIPPGSAVRVRFLKLKGEGEKEKALEVVGGRGGEVEQFSFGENFSAGRAKGFSIASISVFKGVKEMEEGGGKDEVGELVEDVLEVDFVVPASQVASL